jgi:large subunit ribosomal protein L25
MGAYLILITWYNAYLTRYYFSRKNMSKITFSTTSRDLKGKKVRRLRSQGTIPGNIYVSGGESAAIQFSEKEFNKLYGEVGDTGLVYVEVGESKKSRPTLIDEVQVDPASGDVQHVSFKEVDLKEKIEAEVPVEFVGEFDVKEAVMVQVKNSIIVEALPSDLPEKFEVNIEGLTEIGQSITLADLNFDKSKISLVEIEADEDWENPVVLVQEQRQEEVVEEVVEEGDVEDGEEAEKTEETSEKKDGEEKTEVESVEKK